MYQRLGAGLLLLAMGLGGPVIGAPEDQLLEWWRDAHVVVEAEESLDLYRRIILNTQNDSLAALARLERLKGLYSLGRLDQALTEWGEWMAAQPNAHLQGERLYWYVLVLMDAGRIGEAAQALEEALVHGPYSVEDSPYSTALRQLLVACHLELDESDRAAQVAMETVRETRSDDLMPLLLYDLARAHEAGGNYEKAQETWKLLRDSYPSTPEATYAEAEIAAPEEETRAVIPFSPETEDDEAPYHLFIRSFGSMAPAAELTERVDELGVPVRIDELEAPSGPLFSVVAGPIIGRRAADRVKRELVYELEIPGIVILEQPPDEAPGGR